MMKLTITSSAKFLLYSEPGNVILNSYEELDFTTHQLLESDST